ncbi:MAG: DUF2236 domain-containing protein [Gemmatimonadales bacterium]|uniref:oxygenase MpaB family protein n=1 Tax=Candidatus Palauibacter polyketidifaciens TaxID=3056740 RepID=UPI00138353B8|nr:oxygenase MpaB family protein [Candidatus Palauibacter polyketidifaciens]MXX68256.1 DUF2236 domain-containing protein [Gemmatimonadales bacterium]MYH08825.1 DUF2236 domain-containing protein [Gemmatimonadales bacterium]MYL05808.1 DUF2236 domain-containing protein [Gemmatimonadales bacterium]
MNIPSCYVDGYAEAWKVDAKLAEQYIRHTNVGDPVADAVVAALATTASPAGVHRIIAEALEGRGDVPKGTPQVLRDLLVETGTLPDWFDRELYRDATRAFLRNSDMVLGALVGGAIIEGFSTLISRSFRIRGRITTNGVRRLKQNLQQLVDQYLPGGIEPGGDGWRLTIRIRLVHAQARRLIATSDEWDHSVYGVPLSAAHMLLGAAAFSGRLMQHVSKLGGDFSKRDREAYVHVWRHTGLLLGIPDEIMFRDFESSVRCFEIGSLCEPPPAEDAIIMANSIINSAPIVLGYEKPDERRSMAAFMYQVSRELIGNRLADQLRYPAARLKKEVPLLRLRNLGNRILRRLAPPLASYRSMERFSSLFAVSNLGRYEHKYSLPTSVFDEDSAEW